MTYAISVANYEIAQLNECCLIEMPAQFTLTEAKGFEHQFENICQVVSSTTRKIILDFGKTTFIDNNGLICLCQLFRAAKKAGIDLLFWSLSAEIEIIFSLTGLDKVFAIAANTEAITKPL